MDYQSKIFLLFVIFIQIKIDCYNYYSYVQCTSLFAMLKNNTHRFCFLAYARVFSYLYADVNTYRIRSLFKWNYYAYNNFCLLQLRHTSRPYKYFGIQNILYRFKFIIQMIQPRYVLMKLKMMRNINIFL